MGIDKDAIISELIAANELLTLRVKELEERLSKYENPKNSSNSSVSPSQDPYRRTSDRVVRKDTGAADWIGSPTLIELWSTKRSIATTVARR